MVSSKFIASRAMGRNRGILILVGFWLILTDSFSQVATKPYLILLNDKASSPYSIQQPGQFLSQRAIQRRQRQNIAVQERDLPVNPTYVTQLKQQGVQVRYSSRWLNAVLIDATDSTLTRVRALPFVKGIESNRSLVGGRMAAPQTVTKPLQTTKFSQVASLSLAYGISGDQLTQLGIDKMHAQNDHGEGMLIAILDDGFPQANQVSFLKPLFEENRIVGTYDFPNHETNVYNDDDDHGLNVLSVLAATADNQLYGAAYKASYVLLHTEVVATENRIEEAYWLFGAEYADSTGVDVISSSLGYTQFDDPTTDYTYADLDGKTALSTRAAQWATETGMVVVVAAGNDGADPWKYISVPADAASVLAIGAVNRQGTRASFSSVGPSADGRIKPDLVALGQGTVIGTSAGTITTSSGTSFATPLVAGLAAGVWQANPLLTAAQVTDALRRSGSQYAQPDNQLGYGIPNFERATALFVLHTQSDPPALQVFPNPFTDADQVIVNWLEPAVGTFVDAVLTDAAGKLLWWQPLLMGGQFTISGQTLRLPAGLYYLTLTAANHKRTTKLLKR